MPAESRRSVLGHAIERREDDELLRGEARYVADLGPDGLLHAVFVRSQLAHGRIVGLDAEEALEMPGVVAVLGADDLGLPGLGARPPLPGGLEASLARPCLASGRVRFVGEAVAVVVAHEAAQAVDAAEAVVLELEELEAVVDPSDALAPGAPLLFPDDLASNAVLESHVLAGTSDGGTDDVLAGSDVVVSGHFVNQRVAPVPLETGGILVEPLDGGGLLCHVSTQSPFMVRAAVAHALGREPSSVRVVAPAVGGGFGAKGGAYPEHVVIAAVADRLQRPVRWVETRSENLVAMTHGRGVVQDVELGARRDGTIVGLRAATVTDLGAYPWRGGIPFGTARLMATGPYRIERLQLDALGVVTNTTPLGPYRGAGRPEASALLERSIDLLASELGIDPAELRRKNLLRPEDFPYRTPSGASYDSGDYAGALEQALAIARYEALRSEQAARRRRGDRVELGIGLSCFVEVSGSGAEYGSVRVETDGTIVLATGSSPHGQGHETTFAQVVASELGVPMERVRVLHSDTALVARGVGTFGSRSGQLGGSAAARASRAVLGRAVQLAAHLFEADALDVVQAPDGAFIVEGVPSRPLGWAELASAAVSGELPEELSGPLAAEDDFEQAEGSYPFGTHLAVVEVDTETGAVRLERFVAVDDCGVVINPMIVHGQVHGGLAQGIAQALYEQVRYDESGNPLTSTLVDYLVPSAADLPSFELGETVTASPRNPLGVKGVGESGSVGSAAAVQNAVLDALAPYGVRHLDMPLSPERVWQAIAGHAPR